MKRMPTFARGAAVETWHACDIRNVTHSSRHLPTLVRRAPCSLVVGLVTKPFKVQRCLCVPPNAKGRDLVVGDLHGHRHLLERALDQLAFDRHRDRVLSVGDLINRGPHSLETLCLLEEPWFHAVLGNHELMLLNYLGYYGSRIHSRKSFACGVGSWIVAAVADHPKAIARLADRVAALPLALHVRGDASFNVTHGDLHPIGSRPDALLGKRAISVHEADAAASSRVHFEAALEAESIGLQFEQHQVRISATPFGPLPITYVGHSPVCDVLVHDSYVYIDQGVGTTWSRRIGPRLPTVLDHRRFAHWLRGVASAREHSGAAALQPATV